MRSTMVSPLNKPFSAIGLGCVTFGREISAKASFAMMDHAAARGITFFDTAAAYGEGASEMIVGAWRAAHPSIAGSILVATKIQPPYGPESITRSVDKSLKRLRTDVIDLLYLHRWDISFEAPAVPETLNNLIEAGKVCMLGASNFNARQLTAALGRQNGSSIRSVQNNQNLAVSGLGEEMHAICREHNMAVVTYSPLGAGFLTGKYDQGIKDGSRFSVVPGHQDIYFNEAAHRRLARLQKVAGQTGCTPVHLALAWAMHQPGITSVLVGGRTPAHLDQAFNALDFDDPAAFKELESA